MKRSLVSKSLMAAAICAAVLALPSAALASSISGTVTAPGGAGIQGVEVCPSQPGGFEAPCAQTDPSGHYKTDPLGGGNYILRFSAERANLRYVSEFYDDKPYYWEADLFNLGPAEDKTLDAELAEGGSIGGTVTDETTGLPIAGVSACAIDEEGVPSRCADTDSNGEYLLNGLSSGSYYLDYRGRNRVNYLEERYKNPEGEGTGTAVEVTAPLTTSNINVKLSPGAQILGHVKEVGTGSPLGERPRLRARRASLTVTRPVNRPMRPGTTRCGAFRPVPTSSPLASNTRRSAATRPSGSGGRGPRPARMRLRSRSRRRKRAPGSTASCPPGISRRGPNRCR